MQGGKNLKINIILYILFLLLLVFAAIWFIQPGLKENVNSQDKNEDIHDQEMIKLPQPQHKGEMSLQETIFARRSVREYGKKPLTLSQISQLLWAALGKTTQGRMTVPSAGALYPLELYLVVGSSEDLDSGVYKYFPENHSLKIISKGDIVGELSESAANQLWIKEASVVLVLGAVYEKTTTRYGERGIRYVHMEAGHSAQNIYLQSASLGLGTVAVGAFDDGKVKNLIEMNEDEHPLYLMPVGSITP